MIHLGKLSFTWEGLTPGASPCPARFPCTNAGINYRRSRSKEASPSVNENLQPAEVVQFLPERCCLAEGDSASLKSFVVRSA